MESYSVTGGVKATLVKDKTSKAEKTAERQQFIEVKYIRVLKFNELWIPLDMAV